MGSLLAPIAVFAYRRADLLERMFASLRACDGFADSPVTVFVDGAKSAADEADVEAVREFIGGLGLPNVSPVFRDRNLGLKASIVTGVSDLCRRHGRAIVLEDDLLLSPTALRYFNEGLERYRDEARVWNIVGYMYDVPQFRARREAMFLPFTHPWGWATWQRAWERFDIDEAIPHETVSSAAFRKAFDVFGLRDFTRMLGMDQRGVVDSWFIRWNLKAFLEGGLSLFPPNSLVVNAGVSRRGGTHAGRLNPYDLLVRQSRVSAGAVELPGHIHVDYRAIDAIAGSWDARVQRCVSWLGAVKREPARALFPEVSRR